MGRTILNLLALAATVAMVTLIFVVIVGSRHPIGTAITAGCFGFASALCNYVSHRLKTSQDVAERDGPMRSGAEEVYRSGHTSLL
jgi:hypothetical protein